MANSKSRAGVRVSKKDPKIAGKGKSPAVESSSPKAGRETGVNTGAGFDQHNFEQHAAQLSDSRLAHPSNAEEMSGMVRRLQRDYGNAYVQRLVDHISRQSNGAVQLKLTVGPAGDKFEQEADRTAKQVMASLSGMGQEPAQRQGLEEEELQMKPIAQRQGLEEEELQMKPMALETSLSASRAERTVQRLMTAKTFQKITDAGSMARRSSTIREIDEWVAQFHEQFDPPRNASEQELQSSILGEIEEASGRWLANHPQSEDSTTAAKRRPGVEAINKQAVKGKARLAAIDFTTMPEMEISEEEGERIKKVRQKMKGDVQSSLIGFGKIIDFAAPAPGDAASLEVSLDAPVAPGATIGFELNLEAERDESSLEGGLEFLCTGGGTVGAASLKGKLGGYIEGKAKDSEKLMTLVSYGFYRRLVESPIVPREVSNYMWGGSTSSKGKKLAERWAAGVELNIFGDDSDAYVETGGVAALEAELLGGGVSLEGKATSGRHYDKESIEKLKLGKYRERKGKGALKLEDAEIADLVAGPSKKRGAQKKAGEGVRSISFAAAVDAGLIGGELSYKTSWKSSAREKMGTGFFSRSMLKYHAEAWEAGLTGKVTIPLFALGPSGNFAVMLGKWLVSAQKRSKALEDQTNNQAQNEAQKNGLEAEPAMDAGMAFAAMIASSNDFKPEVAWPEDSDSTQAEGTVDLEISGSLDGSYEMGKPKLDEWELSASLVSSLGVSSPMFTTMVTKKTKIWSKTG